jgi:methylmalonyl-CoA mutase cobalamin-binding domain/chain
MERVMVPLMRAVGTGWEKGTLGIAHEHLATAIIRAVLSGIVLSRGLPGSGPGPGIVVTTPARQVHELGALVVAATAASVGWRVTYLGIDMPAESIAEAAAKSGAEAVALSMTHPHDDPDLPGELTRLRERLPAQVTILAGGLAAPAYATALDEIGALVLRDMQSLRTVLTSLRSENGGLAA